MGVTSGNINVLNVKAGKNEGDSSMEKKYQIFISSTYTDLIDERKKVSDTVLSMYHFPIGMEMFSAADEDQWEVIQDTIDSSDYYVLIVGHRYGSVIEEGTEAGDSYTEKEYKYAKSKGIPILAFIIADSVLIAPQNMENDFEKRERLDLFKKEILTGRIVEWWQNKDDLASKVMNALNKQFARKKRPGWVRNNEYELEKALNELSTLSNENRELRKENSELLSQINIRKPNLSVKLCNDNNFVFNYVENNILIDKLREKFKAYIGQIDGITLEKPQINKIKIHEEKVEDISGFKNIQYSQSNEWEIKKYNDELPNEQEISDYVLEKEKYFRCMYSEEDLSIKIENQGTIKASNIDVQIELPNEIILLDFDKFYNIQWPHLNMPMNPFDRFNKGETKLDLRNESKIRLAQLPSNIKCNRKNISIKIKELMHYRRYELKNSFILVPLKKGEFYIKCNIVCDECENATETDIKVQVI